MNLTSHRGIGLMCGTSQDGLDLADVIFTLSDDRWTYELVGAQSFDLPTEISTALRNSTSLSGLEMCELDKNCALFFAESVKTYMQTHKSAATFVASHGVTIFHQPERGISLQIGSGAIIATKTGLTTICDFRQQDVANGGQGAPLVPFCDQILFPKFDMTLNLGGFANITLTDGGVIGYDLCACNLLLNYLSAKTGKPFDDGGSMAREGTINYDLLQMLNALPYFDQSPPKSLGKEWFDANVMPLIDSHTHLSAPSLLATAVAHIADQVSRALHQKNKTCLITGGGAHNTFLIERISAMSASTTTLPDKDLIDYKEAICFAFLGALRLLEKKNTLPSVTGARSALSAGAVYLP